MRQTRRLAAILAADVVGYSRLIGTDEEGTLSRLRSIRAELIDPKLTEHQGRMVKTTGDGLLVEFGSVVDALRCATEWQRGMAGRNARTPDKRMAFRIGINVGDVVVEDGDIFGDGVNVAARLATCGRSATRITTRKSFRCGSATRWIRGAGGPANELCSSPTPARPMRRRANGSRTTASSRLTRWEPDGTKTRSWRCLPSALGPACAVSGDWGG